MDESGLILRLQQGDERAFEPLYRLYVDQAIRVAFLVTRNQQSAEDAAQEAFIQVLRRIHSLRDIRTFRSWFYSILLNAARRTGRKGRRWLFMPIDRMQREQADHSATLPEEAAQHDVEIMQIRQLLNRLPDSHREPIVLRYYAELSEPEIAHAMDIPVGTVKSRLHHARQKLQELIAQADNEGGHPLAARS